MSDWLTTEVTAEEAKQESFNGGPMPIGNYTATVFEAKHETPSWAGPNGIYNVHFRLFGAYENRRQFVQLPIDSNQPGFYQTKAFMEAIGKPVVEGKNHWPTPESLAGLPVELYLRHRAYDEQTKSGVNDSKNHLDAFNKMKALIESQKASGNIETVPDTRNPGQTKPRYVIQERVAGINLTKARPGDNPTGGSTGGSSSGGSNPFNQSAPAAAPAQGQQASEPAPDLWS